MLLDDSDVDTSYEPFSREPEYVQANRAFIDGVQVGVVSRILDIACGTLAMSDLLLDRLDRERQPSQPVPRVYGLDLSSESLTLGRKFMMEKDPVRAAERITLIEGTAMSLPFPDATFEIAIMGNAIQLVPDLAGMLREVHRVLRPGGVFAFNTSFYAGTYCPGTEHVYIRWVQESLDYVLRVDRKLRAEGRPGISRKRGNAGPAFSKPWLSMHDYATHLEDAGLRVANTNERTVMLKQTSFEKIGAYAGLAKVLLSGYPVKLACEAMEKAAGPTLEAVGMTEVPRYWLEMVATKPGA